MDVKPDPKPGRWILPLIIVAMVGFTYIFVNSVDLTGATPDPGGDGGVDIGATTTTSMPVIDTTIPEDGNGELDPDVAAYVTLIQGFNTELDRISGDLTAANSAWDAGTATYSASVDEFRSLITELQTWSGAVAASNPPVGHEDLDTAHQAILDAAADPLDHAQDALAALQSSAAGSAADRRTAVGEVASSAAVFSNAVTAAVDAAGG